MISREKRGNAPVKGFSAEIHIWFPPVMGWSPVEHAWDCHFMWSATSAWFLIAAEYLRGKFVSPL
jgi:hypothetical protein